MPASGWASSTSASSRSSRTLRAAPPGRGGRGPGSRPHAPPGAEPQLRLQEQQDARRRVDVALAKLHESDAHLAAVAEELAQLGAQARSARGEAERLERAPAAAAAARRAH